MNTFSDEIENLKNQKDELRNEFLKYVSFFHWFIIAFVFSLLFSYVYLRYAEKKYYSEAIIEILDKAQDSEMALPTSMTIFNRSMINLENEIGTVSSFDIHRKVVEKLKSNIRYFKSGDIKTIESHPEDFFKSFSLEFNKEINEIDPSIYIISIKNDNLQIKEIKGENSELENDYEFNGLSTSNIDLIPFNLTVNSYDNDIKNWIIKFENIDYTVESFKRMVNIEEYGKESDQLKISLTYPNAKIATEYISTLVNIFDLDGIFDRQLEYRRTIDFVDSRSEFIEKELNLIELRRQEFKEKNNLVDIEYDANININQKFVYDSELFESINQSDLALLLRETLSSNNYELIPVNIGLENESINSFISKYNEVFSERSKILISAGENNFLVKNLNDQLKKYEESIIQSIDNYINSLSIKIQNIQQKELEFSNYYGNIPENEKILRSIERELEVKESLFLLLLQKREEAAINNAVVKPSIKIIDSARSLITQTSPNSIYTYIISILISQSLVFIILFLIFYFDNKVHTKAQLQSALKGIPVLAEIPFLNENEGLNSINKEGESRGPLSESIRILIANLKFIFTNDTKQNKTILVTSSIKGEGKTLVSSNLAKRLSINDNKVLLIGADLRNPQLHKLTDQDKNIKGLSDFIYKPDLNVDDLIIPNGKLHILYSGTIPPNPTELLSTKKFKNLINSLSKKYDYIVIDSAPCILVSDTFEIASLVDATIFVTRSNFTKTDICDFINECNDEKRLKNMSIVLNGVGNSRGYGYKYSYQYGYKYAYNYGYGYGYKEEKN